MTTFSVSTPAYHTNLHYIRLHIVHDSLYLPRNNLGRNIEELLNTERILYSDAGYRRNSITAQLGNRPDVRLYTTAFGAAEPVIVNIISLNFEPDDKFEGKDTKKERITAEFADNSLFFILQ